MIPSMYSSHEKNTFSAFQEDPLRTIIFHMYVKIDPHYYKLLVDSGRSFDSISQDAST